MTGAVRMEGSDRMNSLNRKILTAMLMSIAVLSAGIAVYAYSVDPVSVDRKTEKVMEFRGNLKHYADFSNESIYGESASLSIYPKKITERIHGKYTLTATPQSSGRYIMTIDATYYIQNGKDRIQIWRENILTEKGEFEGVKSLNFTLMPSSLSSDLKRVKEGTGFSRVIQSVTITVRADAGGEEFTHSIPLASGSDTIAFKDTEKRDEITRDVKTVEENSVTGQDVKSARLLYGILTMSALIPAIAINRNQITEIRSKRSESRSYIIEGRQEGRRVVLNSFEDLKKVFQLSDSPVLKTEDDYGTVYTVTHDGVLYEFRKRD